MTSKQVIEREVLSKLNKQKSDYLPSLWRNKEFVIEAIKYDADALYHACKAFKSDKEIVTLALQNGGYPLEMSPELLNDREFTLETIKYSANYFNVYPEELRSDYDIALEAVSHSFLAIQFVPDELMHNREILLAAIKHDGSALFVPCLKEYLNDYDLCLLAMQTAGIYFDFLKEEFRYDRAMTLAAVKSFHAALSHTSDILKDDKEVVLASVQAWCTHFNFKEASLRLRSDKEVALEAVKHCGCSFEFVGEELKKDMDVILSALETNPFVYNNLSDDLKKDKKILETFHKYHPDNEIIDGVAQPYVVQP